MNIDTTDNTIDNKEDTDKNCLNSQTVMNLESHVTQCSSAWWGSIFIIYKLYTHQLSILSIMIFIYLLPIHDPIYCPPWAPLVATPGGAVVALLCSFCHNYVNVIMYLGKWQQKIDANV